MLEVQFGNTFFAESSASRVKQAPIVLARGSQGLYDGSSVFSGQLKFCKNVTKHHNN